MSFILGIVVKHFWMLHTCKSTKAPAMTEMPTNICLFFLLPGCGARAGGQYSTKTAACKRCGSGSHPECRQAHRHSGAGARPGDHQPEMELSQQAGENVNQTYALIWNYHEEHKRLTHEVSPADIKTHSGGLCSIVNIYKEDFSIRWCETGMFLQE